MALPNLNTFSPLASPFGQKVSALGSKNDHIVVTGAGAFGGWSALYLLRKGFKVTLIDAWGAGNSRASSGDETRVIRSTYGANEFYFDLNARALALWKENQERFGKQLFYNTGVLWLCYEEKTPLVDDSIPFAHKHGMAYEYLSVDVLKKRYSVLNVDDLHHGYFDPSGGYLKAREACQRVQEAFINEGGHFIQGWVKPGKLHAGKLTGLSLSNGHNVTADAYLFACGPWLNQLFPGLQNFVTCTKQELYYFGVPNDQATAYENFPVWVDVDGKNFYYGIPGNAHRGFKIGVDIRGESFDPTSGEHTVTAGVLTHARNFLAHRFPTLRNAPLLESRVCPYESSPDGNFIFEPHPEASNAIFLGGGSGHGFKHGPALGELVAGRLSR
jgi:glycine/D-amino acid oxidase-like deaminating enzyme